VLLSHQQKIISEWNLEQQAGELSTLRESTQRSGTAVKALEQELAAKNTELAKLEQSFASERRMLVQSRQEVVL
jgi:hypothetical protein